VPLAFHSISDRRFLGFSYPNFAEKGAWSHLTVISATRTATAPSIYNLSENKCLRQSFAQLAPDDSYSILRPDNSSPTHIAGCLYMLVSTMIMSITSSIPIL
jgi:hypothetical protein